MQVFLCSFGAVCGRLPSFAPADSIPLRASVPSEGEGRNRGEMPQVDSHCKKIKTNAEEDRNPTEFSQSGNKAEGVSHLRQQQMTGTFTLFIQLSWFFFCLFIFFFNQGLGGKESNKPAANRLSHSTPCNQKRLSSTALFCLHPSTFPCVVLSSF